MEEHQYACTWEPIYKMLMSESPFLLSHPVITPMLYLTEEGCKQLLEMVLMGDSIT